MFILAFILSLLNISQILPGTSSSIDENSIKKKFGEEIPQAYICDHSKLGYENYIVHLLGTTNTGDKNNLIQNKVNIEKFVDLFGGLYNKQAFEKIFNFVKTTIVNNISKIFPLSDEEKKDIVMECPIKIPDNPKNDQFKILFGHEEKEENILNIFKEYHKIRSTEMSYLYLQKDTIRKKNYIRIADNFDFKDYKGQTLFVILNLETQNYIFLAKNQT